MKLIEINDISQHMSVAEKNYSITEQHALAIVFACKMFPHNYLLG